MPLPSQSVRDFINDSYQIISANTPTVPLHGNDQSKGLQYLNELISFYSGTGLMLTIAKEEKTTVKIGQKFITFADPLFTPLADVPFGRLANLQNAWLILDGVTYPLFDEIRNTFLASYKFEPLKGLPRFAIVYNNTNYTTLQIYPAPSQAFELFVYGKFELNSLLITDNMSGFPAYYIRYLRFALAKDLAAYKGRLSAWDDKLEQILLNAEKDMQSVSSVNLDIESDYESLLNGAWRVRSGV